MPDDGESLAIVVARLSRLVRLDPSDVDAAVQDALERLAQAAGADRIRVRVVEPGRMVSHRVYTWSAAGVPQEAGRLKGRNEGFRLSWQAIDRDEAIQIPDVRLLPESARDERVRGETYGVRSSLMVPVRASPEMVHVLTLQTVHETRTWSDDEVALLRLAVEIFVDAIWRSQALGALRESEARFRALAEHAIELISEMDGEGRYTYVSPSFGELLGYPPEDLLGKGAHELIHPDDLAASAQGFTRALAQTGISHAVHRLRHADGSWRWFENTGRAYRTDAGEIRFVSIGRDITERRQMEQALRESEATLLQSQKMEALGRLAGGVAHDFNNLLMVILGNAEVLRARMSEAGLPAGEAAEILTSVDRAADLTRQLLAFGRPALHETRRLDLCEIVARLTPMLQRLLGEDVHLVADTGCADCMVDGVESQLEQVVVNLVLNARDALPQGGRIHVGACLEDADGVLLTVRDNGVGIEAETLPHVFEPFFTTKDPGKGTGLGLSVVYGIAQRMGGSVDVQSEPGRGSTFRVRLPRSNGGLARERVAGPEADKSHRGDETILLVEDEIHTRRLIRGMLEDGGYTVVEARNGIDALDLLRTRGVDLLVTDVVMPRMRGGELVERARALRPGLPVLFISGYADDTLPPDLRGDAPGSSGYAFLPKPFSREQLGAKARTLLDATSG